MKIPKGWRKLRSGVFLRTGDKFYSSNRRRWVKTIFLTCDKVKTVLGDRITYIRKIEAKK